MTPDDEKAARGRNAPPLEVQPTPRGVRIELPERQLGLLRKLGWVVAGMGLFGLILLCFWMRTPILLVLSSVKNPRPELLIPLFMIGFGLTGVFYCGRIVLAGLTLIADRTRCIIEVGNGVVRSREQFLFGGWTRKCRTDQIRRLRIRSVKEHPELEFALSVVGNATHVLIGERGKGEAMWAFLIAPGYPGDLIRQLAGDLAPRIEAEIEAADRLMTASMDSENEQEMAVEIVVGGDEQVDSGTGFEVPSQPPESTATIERRDGGITIHIPPAGLLKGSKGLLFFSIVWNAFISIFVVVLVSAALNDVGGDRSIWFLVLFLIPFVGVGVGTALAAVNMGKRWADVATAFDSLLVIRHTIFGKSTREWRAEEIKEIRVGPSGLEINNQPVNELQIHDTNGQVFGMLSQRADDELHWIAGELVQSLKPVSEETVRDG